MDTNQSEPQPESNAPAPEIDQMKMQMLMQQISDNQNLSLAVLGGSAAALVGAAVWAAVTVATNWQIGFMASRCRKKGFGKLEVTVNLKAPEVLRGNVYQSVKRTSLSNSSSQLPVVRVPFAVCPML